MGADVLDDDPARYRYARHKPRESGPDQAVEYQLRAAVGIPQGPIPQSVLDGVEELWLVLHKAEVDFSPLQRLPRLRDLTVDSSVPLDLESLVSALAEVTGLRGLHIEAPVGDIAALAAATGLTELGLAHTRVVDLSPLRRLRGLATLSITDGPLWDLSGLSGLPLTCLEVNNTRVADLAPLAMLPSLERLHLAGCPVRDLTVITALPALREVNATGTGIGHLGDLPVLAAGVEITGGEPVTARPATPRPAAELFARFRDTTESAQREALLPQLIATRETRCVAAAIQAMRYSPEPVTVNGMLFADGRGDSRFAANPWGVPAGAGLAEALAHIWDPIAAEAPRFASTVKQRTFALVLYTDTDGVAELGYLQLDFPDFRPALRLLRGTWPDVVDPAAVVPALAAPMPPPLRRWRAAHETFSDISGYIGGSPVGSLRHDFDDPHDLAYRLGGCAADRFVTGAGGSDGELFLLDLDVLDAAGDPTVASWQPGARANGTGDGRPHGHTRFWDWLDGDGVDLLFR